MAQKHNDHPGDKRRILAIQEPGKSAVLQRGRTIATSPETNKCPAHYDIKRHRTIVGNKIHTGYVAHLARGKLNRPINRLNIHEPLTGCLSNRIEYHTKRYGVVQGLFPSCYRANTPILHNVA